MNDEVGFHFGRVPSYTIYDDERDEVDVIPNESSHRGGSGLPADLLAEQGVDAMVCGDLGRKALTLFDDHCIEVYTGYSGKKVSEALKEWQEGNSSPASEGDGCQEHAFRDESHQHKGDRRHG
ncbi:NifB/NifX family molybdenum-iron cluster-binding protein [Candidatus Bipolaricaulota bacterium]|nr:NifB/NifX family molybdenum-iron cluster-binding protein [Candidatus Bipolaricaulota bacterium]